jgi:hypothetical protein
VTASDTGQARQAALLLHSLPAVARQRVIAKLDRNESSRLEPLLAELLELGVSSSFGEQRRRIGSADLDPVPALPACESTLQALTAIERAERLDPNEVVRCLQGCAPKTVVRLLSSHGWPWTRHVLGRFPEARRIELMESMRGNPPALARGILLSLCESLCADAARLGAQSNDANTPLPSLWSALSFNLKARLGGLFGWKR